MFRFKENIYFVGKETGPVANKTADNAPVCTLSVSDIRKAFGINEVLKGVSISLRAGEVLALIGGNGAGKSTLMKIIMGIYRADSGTIEVDGKPVSLVNPSAALSAGIYMVPQEPMLFPNMTVRQNILCGLNREKDRAAKEKSGYFYKCSGYVIKVVFCRNGILIYLLEFIVYVVYVVARVEYNLNAGIGRFESHLFFYGHSALNV